MDQERPENGKYHNNGNRRFNNYNKNRNFRPNRNNEERAQKPNNNAVENNNETREPQKDFNGQRRNDEPRFNRNRFERRNPNIETKEDIIKDCEHIESQIVYEINDIKTISTSLF